jgi:hypothetical protein
MNDETVVNDEMSATRKQLDEKVEEAWQVIDKLMLHDLNKKLQLISDDYAQDWKRAAQFMEPILVDSQELRIKQCRSLVLQCARPLILLERPEILGAAVHVFRNRADAIGQEMVDVWKRLDRKNLSAKDEVFSQTFRDMTALLEFKCASSKTWLALDVEAGVVIEQRGHQLETASLRAAEAAEAAAIANEKMAEISFVAATATQRAADATTRAADATSSATKATKKAARATKRAAVAAEDATKVSRWMVAVTVLFVVVTAIGSFGSIWYSNLAYNRPDPKSPPVTVTLRLPSDESPFAAQGPCIGVEQRTPIDNLKSGRLLDPPPPSGSKNTHN